MEVWSQWVSQASSDPYMWAAGIALGSLLIGLLTRLVLGRALAPLFRRTRSTLDDQALAHLGNPVSWTVVAVGFSYAAHSLDPSEHVSWGIHGVLGSLTMFVWSVGLLKFTTAVVEERSARPAGAGLLNMRTGPVFDIGARLLVYAGSAYGLLLAWGIDPTAWLASAGIIGVAGAFAAQQTLGDLIAGVSILADTPYKIGDYLTLENGLEGRVYAIGMRTTRLVTNDGEEIILPNARMASQQIVNQTGGHVPTKRVRVVVSVPYGADITQVRTILTDAAERGQGVRSEPAPTVQTRLLGDSSVQVELLFWVDEPRRHQAISSEVREAVLEALAGAGITIPFPQQTVHLVNPEPNSQG